MSVLSRFYLGNVFLLLGLGLKLAPLYAEEFRYARAVVVTKGGISIPVEVSDTPAKRGLGLGNRDAHREWVVYMRPHLWKGAPTKKKVHAG